MMGPQLDLFAELERSEREANEANGIPSLFGSPARGLVARQDEFEEWQRTYGSFASLCDSHAWVVEWTAPSAVTDTCQATVLHADLRCDHDEPCYCVGDLVCRGACTGCAWEGGAVRASEDDAVADALDHCFPGWRQSPIVVSQKGRGEVTQHPTRPDGWPIIVERGPGAGRRPVPGRSPWGGYDVDSSILMRMDR
ncbi:DUF6349 family protein [Skermania sp. ID1734]|uniref:DUF6349 family protein n=1 Tax=Skermania sp. ID1734 TaxID=2597516 RepID=UPI001C8F1FB6